MSTVLETHYGIRGKAAAVIGNTPIGQAVASLFDAAGARTCLLPTVGEGDVLDPCDEGAVAERLSAFASASGGLDILVYAATRVGTYPLTQMTLEQWDGIHNMNLRGAFVAMREAVKLMQGKRSGRIVAVSTMGSLHPVLHGNAGYSASKAGLNGLVRAVAADHLADGILVNAVLPGAVAVGPIPEDAVSQGGPATQPGRLVLGIGDADDVAAAVLYLASPAAKFITGQSLVLDGGFLVS
ncbi:MAG: SDR family oxidoreductase [Sphingorhabdus sp.]